MKSTKNFKTSNPEMVTISRAEYEKFLGQEQQLLAQNERISRLENHRSLNSLNIFPTSALIFPHTICRRYLGANTI